jgi:hypothetical protein
MAQMKRCNQITDFFSKTKRNVWNQVQGHPLIVLGARIDCWRLEVGNIVRPSLKKKWAELAKLVN